MAKIFVSYSRKDSVTARKLIQALKDMQQDVWVDWEDIPPATDWLEQIFRGIEGSDAFIFLISPDSAASEVCKVEVGHAAKNSKRIIPVVLRQVPPQETVDAIRKINWTFMREEDSLEEAMARLKTAIELDFEWVEEHSRLQTRALEWDRRKEPSLLLRGTDLWSARQKITRAEKKDPLPTELQRSYIDHSNRNERRNFIILTLAFITIITMAALSYTALVQKRIATENANEAIKNKDIADANARKALANAKTATRAKQAAEKARQRAEEARDAAEVSRNQAAAQRSVARAQIYQFRPGELYTSTLLAIDSWQTRPSNEAEEILRENISLLPVPVNQMSHTGRINTVEFNPEGDIFVTAGADGTACAWQVSDGKRIFCADSPGAINDAVFSPAEKIVITGDSQGFVQIINAEDGIIEKQILLSSPIRDVDIRKDGRFAAVTSEDGKITLIDLNAREKYGIDLEGTNIKFASFSPNGLQIASGSDDGVVSIWYLNEANKVINTRKHKGEILTLEFSPNGRILITGGADGAAVVTEVRTGKELYRTLHDDQVKDIAFSPDGTWFVTASNDRKIRVWDTNNGEQILLMSQSNFVQAVKVSANGQWIASTGDDKTVRVWNASTGTELFQIPINGKGSALGFSKDGKYLIAGDQNGFINIWNISAIPAPVNYLQFEGVTTSALYSPTGNLVAASDDKRAWLLSPNSFSNLTTRPAGSPFLELNANITKVIFSANDKWIGVLTAANEVFIYGTQNRSSKTIRPENLVQALVFAPDEKNLLIGDSAGNLQVWDASTGRLINTPIANGRPITAMAATSKLLAIGMENELHILDIHTFAELVQPKSHGDHELLVFSLDGSLLASSNATGQIHIWDQENGNFTEPKIFTKAAALSMAFNPSNNLLAIGSIDNVYLINPSTLEEFARIPHTGSVSSVAFSVDGATLLTSSLKVLQFWNLAKIQEIKKANIAETACQHLIENLSGDLWNTLFETERYRTLCANLPVP